MQKPSGEAAPSFRIRTARRGDVDAIATLMNELGYPNAPDVSTVHWVLSHPEMEVIVACDSMDKPVGLITLSHRPQLRMKGRIVSIDELVVAPNWRRRRVGTELMRRALERAKVLSAKRVEIVTHRPRGDSVKRFYESCGFTEAGSFVMRHTEMDFQRR